MKGFYDIGIYGPLLKPLGKILNIPGAYPEDYIICRQPSWDGSESEAVPSLTAFNLKP